MFKTSSDLYIKQQRERLLIIQLEYVQCLCFVHVLCNYLVIYARMHFESLLVKFENAGYC